MQYIETLRAVMLDVGLTADHDYVELADSNIQLFNWGITVRVRYDIRPEPDETFLLIKFTDSKGETLRFVASYPYGSEHPNHMEFITEGYNPDVVDAFDSYFSMILTGGPI
jgi:hypothetical protein